MNLTPAKQPEHIPQQFVEAWNQRDAKKIASLFDPEAEFINVTGLWWHQRKAIERAHDYGLRTIFNQSTLTIVKTKVRLLTDTVATVHAKMKLTGQTPTKEVPHPGIRQTIFTFVVHWQGQRWSCAAAHNTDIVSAMETHIRNEDGKLIPVDYRKSGNPS
ncbi:MAG: SgcJ/EcaC family oxidoreductase [Cyclobacteriaceae bacterium]